MRCDKCKAVFKSGHNCPSCDTYMAKCDEPTCQIYFSLNKESDECKYHSSKQCEKCKKEFTKYRQQVSPKLCTACTGEWGACLACGKILKHETLEKRNQFCHVCEPKYTMQSTKPSGIFSMFSKKHITWYSLIETEEKKYKKKAIPTAVRNAVWNEYIGKDKAIGKCYCCNSEISHQQWEAGHIIAEVNGGEATVANLRPTCGSCNKSCNSMNMDDFKAKFQTQPPQTNDKLFVHNNIIYKIGTKSGIVIETDPEYQVTVYMTSDAKTMVLPMPDLVSISFQDNAIVNTMETLTLDDS